MRDPIFSMMHIAIDPATKWAKPEGPRSRVLEGGCTPLPPTTD